jgi:hypothetical protein
VTQPRPEPAREPFPPGSDSPPPGPSRKLAIVIAVVVAALLIALVTLHLTGVMGAGSH